MSLKQNNLTSAETRAELDKWFKNSEYSKISFTVAFNKIVSLEALEAELLACFQEMDEQKKNGTFKPIPLSELVI